MLKSSPDAIVGLNVDDLRAGYIELGLNARSAGTLATYASRLKVYADFCRAHDLLAFPAATGTLPMFIAWQERRGLAASTISARITTVIIEHRRRGLGDFRTEALKDVLSGARRKIGTAPKRKAALTRDQMQQLVEGIPTDLRGLRDRAMIALAYHGAMRRSEVCGIEIERLTVKPNSVEIFLPRSKTEQEGKGATIMIHAKRGDSACPVMALRSYLAAANIGSGPVFRAVDKHGNMGRRAITGRAFCTIVQGHIASVLGLDACEYGAHSLRASFATNLDGRGHKLADIMERGRWRSAIVAQGYIRPKSFEIDLSADL